MPSSRGRGKAAGLDRANEALHPKELARLSNHIAFLIEGVSPLDDVLVCHAVMRSGHRGLELEPHAN